MGKIKYTIDEFDKRYYMFAKANIYDDMKLTNILYDHDLFIYSFISQKIPNCIGIVPIVKRINCTPNKDYLDAIYERYTEKVNRKVEGFVIDYKNMITKYVRYKNLSCNNDLSEIIDDETREQQQDEFYVYNEFNAFKLMIKLTEHFDRGE